MVIEGKRVLVTGASRGLGRTLTFAFAAGRAKEVVAGTRTQKDREALETEAQRIGARIIPVQLDVRHDEDVNAVAANGTFDILINNAGVAGYGNPVLMDFNTIEEELAVNYLGSLRMIRAIAPAMMKQNSGAIVNVATAFAKVNLPIVGTYCATKAALLSLGQAVRAHVSRYGVKVITVMPTTIDTDMSRGADIPKMTKEYVADEILSAIREEKHDPPIGDEAKGILEQLAKDGKGLEEELSRLVG